MADKSKRGAITFKPRHCQLNMNTTLTQSVPLLLKQALRAVPASEWELGHLPDSLF